MNNAETRPAKPDFDAWIDAFEAVLEMAITPEYRPGVKLNLEIAARFAALVNEFTLPDETDPAPLFTA